MTLTPFFLFLGRRQWCGKATSPAGADARPGGNEALDIIPSSGPAGQGTTYVDLDLEYL